MAKVYDIVAVIGKYTDRSGAEKSRYMNCGFVNKSDKGHLSIKLDGLPVGNPEWNGWLSCFEPKNASQKAGKHESLEPMKQDDFEDSEIPF